MKAFYIKMPGLTSIDEELHMGISSISTTEAGAWRRHIGFKEGTESAWEPREISRRIQAWFDKGYRVVEIEIIPPPNPNRKGRR